MKRVLRTLFIVLCLGVMIFSGIQICRELLVYHEGDESYQELETYIVIPEAPVQTPAAETTETPSDAPVTDRTPEPEKTDGILWPEVDFAALAEINPDVVGWIYCEGTVISYPVVQGTDNDYYLKHMFDGTVHKSGCPFLDAGNHSDFSDTHSVIYGHYLKSGSMFQSLSNYKKQAYYDEHPTLLLLTPDQNYVIRLFAGYVCPGDGDAWQLSFRSDEELEKWLQTACRKSTFASGITPTATDRIITLSTCSYEFEDARYVVLGILTPQE